MSAVHRTATGLLSVLGLALGLAPAAAGAQSCTVVSPGACSLTTSASLTVPAVINVQVGPGDGTQPATLADFEAGFGSFAGPAITISANTAWAISISAGNATWGASNTLPGISARPDKPAGDLLWSLDGAAYTPLAISAMQLGSGGATNAAVLTIDYRVLYSLTLDTPGMYEMVVLLTVTSP
ncbi:MAG TPA: hypothetical protein VMM18_06605 [Gemmatimonadaceae bacterium]|nr:hypothetical protein [Gemmatimonadaceae bacterium]